MAKDLTEKQLKTYYEQAMDAYANKLKLEVPFSQQLKKLFAETQKEFKEFYAKHGAAPSLDELEKMLNDQHVKVGNKFSNQIRDTLGKPNSSAEAIQRKLEANIKGAAAQRAHMYSHEITDTTRNNFNHAITTAHENAALQDLDATPENISKLASEHLGYIFEGRPDTGSLGRVNNIATTETQVAAETGKSLELSTLDSFNAMFGDTSIKDIAKQKVWITVLDTHTRISHADADTQVVDIDEPFIVGDAKMMAPGDESMGAGPEEIINCRCSRETVLE